MTTHEIGTRQSLRWLFPLVYLTVTHSTVGLMVIVGLFGNPILAADIALAQGATVATFHALSANTRMLILGQSNAVRLADLVRLRIFLVVPLAIAAFFLATAGAGVPAWLALALVVRRCADWFNDIQLCKAELAHRTRFALVFLVLQGALLAMAAASLVLEWGLAPFAIAAWALVPLGLAISLRRDLHGEHSVGFPPLLRRLLPHAGSTAVSGLALYAFRILVVLLIAKELAGDLFTAIAIGSFIGTAFTNVLGPSLELHERRTGRGLPRSVQIAMGSTVALGFVITAAAISMPSALRAFGKAEFFWLAAGLSLIGGVVMVQAARVRLRVMRPDDGRDIFGPEVLLHVALLVTTPILILAGSTAGVTSLYLVNAVLAYLFYRSSEMAQQRTATQDRRYLGQLRFVIGFLLVFPLFFQLTGRISSNPNVVMDSGGQLSTLPLPVSMLACFAGILVLADYRRATRSVAFVFLFFAALLLAAVANKPAGGEFERAVLLMLMQCLLPTFGLVLGEMLENDAAWSARTIERAFFWACATIIPAQLLASWVQGQAVLTHWLWIFSVYQHQQFVPVVLACATLVAAPVLWHESRYRAWAIPLMVLSLMYALAASSLLAIGVSGVGFLAFASRSLSGFAPGKRAGIAALSLLAIGALAILVIRTPGNDLWPKLMTHQALQESVRGEFETGCEQDAAGPSSPIVATRSGEWIVTGAAPAPKSTLIRCQTHAVDKGGMLVVGGEIRKGGITVTIVGADGTSVLDRRVSEPGKFWIELRPPEGTYRALVASHLPQGSPTDLTIARIAWRPTMSESPVLRAGEVPEIIARNLPLNIVERIADWMLFGRPVFSSVQTFLFGHPKPMDRSIRSSAHNYYIDLAYNFGVVALLPLFGLLSYTVRLLWRNRRSVSRFNRLSWLAAIVLFLLLIDSNLKVTLRQPYSGIFAFFLWGLLIARLRTHAPASVPTPTHGRLNADRASRVEQP
jgi:hypothetical protein